MQIQKNAKAGVYRLRPNFLPLEEFLISRLYFLEIVQDYNIVTLKIETQKSSMYFRHASLSNSVDATDQICYNGGGLVQMDNSVLISAIDIKEITL